MNKKKSSAVWRKLCGLLTVTAGIALIVMSAAAVLTVMGVPWDRWLSSTAKGVMAYMDMDEQQLPGSVVIVSAGDIRPVEWKGRQDAVVSGSDVALMSEPDGGSDIVCKMDGGKKAVIIGQKGNWYRLRYVCYTGWVPLTYAKPEGDRTEYEPDRLEKERTLHAQDAADTAKTASDSDAARMLDSIANKYGAVGAQAAVIKNGEVVYVHSFGYANRKEGKPMTDDTKIRIASVSKLGVAMAAMVMAEEGIVDLDADISDYLGFKVRNPQYSGVPLTLRMLLTHTSTVTADINARETYKSFVKKLGGMDAYHPGWKPGEDYAWSYSNAGICLAGMTLEAASGVVLVDFVDNYFFGGMGVDASYHASHIKDKDRIADLYEAGRMCLSADDQMSRPYSDEAGTNFRLYAGDLTISAKDLARLMCVLAGDGTYDGMYYMSPGSVEELQKEYVPQKNFSQCLTIRRKEDFFDGRTLYYHTGNAYGTLAFACYDDETRDGVVILTTGAEGGSIKGVYSVCYYMTDYLFNTLL